MKPPFELNSFATLTEQNVPDRQQIFEDTDEMEIAPPTEEDEITASGESDDKDNETLIVL